MARHSNKLSARAVAALSLPGRHSDGNNLYLFLDEAGRRRWVFRYVRGGKAREMGLGGYPAVSLAEARGKAAKAREALSAGADPIEVRRAASISAATFGRCARELVETKSQNWRNARHTRQWLQSLETHAAPLWGLPVGEIDVAAILRVLQPIWKSVPETASRVQSRIETVLDAAKARGLIDNDRQNPGRWKGHLDNILSKRSQLSRGQHAAMDYTDAPAFVERLTEIKTPAARALEFTIITGARLGETLGATWDEIDFEARIWTVPGTKMKAGREHRVPLSESAVAVLKALASSGMGSTIFHVSDKSLRKLLPGGSTIHGFRATLSTWATEETNFPSEIVEAALAHAVGTRVQRAYKRGDVLEKRRDLMRAWDSYLRSISVGNISQLILSR